MQWTILAAALLFLAGAAGYFVAERGDDPPGADSVDVGFLLDMIAHHEQALEMSSVEIVEGTERGVQTYANEILLFQSYEIGLMERQLNDWGFTRQDRPATAMAWMGMSMPAAEMPGLASTAEMEALGESAGRDVDALFLVLMRDHHEGGVHMASYAAEHASNQFVRDLAARMARNQRVEIGELERTRERLQLPASPSGYGL